MFRCSAKIFNFPLKHFYLNLTFFHAPSEDVVVYFFLSSHYIITNEIHLNNICRHKYIKTWDNMTHSIFVFTLYSSISNIYFHLYTFLYFKHENNIFFFISNVSEIWRYEIRISMYIYIWRYVVVNYIKSFAC